MSRLPIKNDQGEQCGEYELSEDVLVYDKGIQSLHRSVVVHRRNARAGTASTLGRSEVAGSNNKPWRQKGTGRARAGTRRSPIWRGGGVVFGPKSRSYTTKMPKKMKRLAFRRAFSEKVALGQVTVVDQIRVEEAKTKQVVSLFQGWGLSQKALLIIDQMDGGLKLATRNLADVGLSTSREVSAYQLLCYPLIVISQAALKQLEERLKA